MTADRRRPVSVLFVCMGNICRSPTAEGVFRRMVQEAGLEERVHVDSAGTHGYHLGAEPDRRSQAAAARRGYDLSALRARQLLPEDGERFDLVLAMDRDNLARSRGLLRGPAELRLLMDFAEERRKDEVPDPYYTGGEAGFEEVLDMIEEAGRGLMDAVRQRLEVEDTDQG